MRAYKPNVSKFSNYELPEIQAIKP